ncbi:hypothetical protein JOQ06_022611 [Pogonophryne albipinna]|uniref:Rap guanine nucleotide exchange factor 3 n=1 Tax=Pogonophryne albipinna TaxID=1090488 RepID=A0AAD6F3A8_9TELE|nr:hypothetical protein JOQ06_022611 [Pogonophryne albipinna]
MRLERFRVKTPGTGAMLARCLLSFCGLLLSVSRPGEAFNLDVENPAVYTGPNGSYFGYSVDFYLADSASVSVVIGAPKANTTQLNVTEGGSVFYCPWSIGQSDCHSIDFDSEGEADTAGPDKRLQLSQKDLIRAAFDIWIRTDSLYSAFTETLARLLISSQMFFEASVETHTERFIACYGDRTALLNNTEHQIDFKSHQWFGATVRSHGDTILFSEDLFSQGDKGTSWYIIWKGSVNVITHGKGLVTTLHEGEDFGQLALLNDAPRAATIILREDNCHFLRVDKHDFIRILKDVEANTVRLEEHGKSVLVLERSEGEETGGAANNSKYTVMSGTPEKILEHLLDTVKLDSNGNDAIDPCVSDFLLTHKLFMPSSQLLLLNRPCTYNSKLFEGSDQEKANYVLTTKQKVVKLIGQWVALYGLLLKEDSIAMDFLERLKKEVAVDYRLTSMLKDQFRDRRRTKVLENGYQSLSRNQQFDWFSNCEEPVGRLQPIRAQDKVLYEIYRPDYRPLTLMLPVSASVQEVMSATVQPGGDHVLVKMNSSGERAQLKLDASAVFTAMGLNERLFVCSSSQVDQLTPLKEQQGPEQGTLDVLEQMGSKDIASELTNYDWELFTAMHEVELVYYIFGRHKFHGAITANLERFVRRFNEVQYWVVTELCLCEDLMKRAVLLKKFIKIAAVLKEQKNLNSFFAVMFGLSNSAVHRLYKTWERIPSKIKRIYCAYERLMDPSRNHRAYRLAVAKLSPPYIPFMPLLLKDMTFINEGNPNYVDKLVNFEKVRMIAKTVKIVRGCRSQPYVPSSPQRGLADRMFLEGPSNRISTCSEYSLPLRSPSNIRHYIQNLKVVDNQRKLTQLSRTIEC